jgi:transposase
MTRHEWSETECGMALGLCASDRFPLREISNIINIPKSTVEDIKQRGIGVSKPRSGRPKKLSSRDIRQIIRYLRTSKFTRRINLCSLKKMFNLTVHENTIHNALVTAGYYHRIARRRPYLNKRDRKRRLIFAKEHVDWPLQQWARVLFCDEMSIKLFMERKTRDFVWRKADEEFHPDCINYKKRPQGTGLMFWGVFRKGKMGPGVFFNLAKGESVDSTIYRDQILLGPLQQFWEESFESISCPIVMEDNAPVYKKVCIATREELGMVTLDWPPNSPDLNPIENIWSFMKDIIARDYADVSSVEEMRKIVRGLWENFTDNQWDMLIDSMKERMEAVIAANGGSTRF